MVLAPGADDNASGVAAVLTAATLFAAHDFAYSIQYVCFGGEETGLDGSYHFASEAAANGQAIAGMLNFDMIGWWQEGVDFDLEIETNEASTWLAEISVAAAELYAGMPYELHVNDQAWWGDHWPFWQNGFAAVNHEESYDWFDPDFNPRYHSTTDLLIYLSPEFTVGNVKVAVAALATLAVPDPAAAVPPVPPADGTRLVAYPNPFNGRATLRVTGLPDRDGATLEIHDLRGRRVAALPVVLDEGSGRAVWQAVDRDGRALPSGLYLVSIQGVDGIVARPIVYVK
jgi:hypothetical protein